MRWKGEFVCNLGFDSADADAGYELGEDRSVFRRDELVEELWIFTDALDAKELQQASDCRMAEGLLNYCLKAAGGVVKRDSRSLIFSLIGVPLTAQLYFLGIRLAVMDMAEVVLAAISVRWVQAGF